MIDAATTKKAAFDVILVYRRIKTSPRLSVFSMDIALANSFATCGRHSQEATGFASGAEANRA